MTSCTSSLRSCFSSCFTRSNSDYDNSDTERVPLRSAINSPNPRSESNNSLSYARILTNIVATAALGASSAMLYAQYSNKIEKDPRILTATFLGLGASLRALIEANLSKNAKDAVQIACSKWYFETYEILWNAYINVTNAIGEESILNTITTWGGFSLFGDWIFPFKIQQQDRAHQSTAEIDLNQKCVNPIVGPAFDNLKGQLVLKTALTVAGIGLAAFSYVLDTGYNVLYRSLGYFLATQGIGYGLANGAFALWKYSQDTDLNFNRPNSIRKLKSSNSRREENLENAQLNRSEEGSEVALETDSSTEEEIDLSSTTKVTLAPGVSFTTKAFRACAKVARSFGAEILASLYLIDKPLLYIPAGFIYGAIQYIAQRNFQVITAEDYEDRKKKNCDPSGNISTALIVERIASGIFLALFLGWFTFGDVVSPFRDELDISIFMASYLLTCGLGITVDHFFKPEQTGNWARVVNHLRYILFHHPYSIAIAYLSLLQISQINDSSLQLDSNKAYVCGSIAVSLFGINFALNRVRNTSKSNYPPITIAPAVARMIFFRTMYDRFTNKFNM